MHVHRMWCHDVQVNASSPQNQEKAADALSLLDEAYKTLHSTNSRKKYDELGYDGKHGLTV